MKELKTLTGKNVKIFQKWGTVDENKIEKLKRDNFPPSTAVCHDLNSCKPYDEEGVREFEMDDNHLIDLGFGNNRDIRKIYDSEACLFCSGGTKG